MRLKVRLAWMALAAAPMAVLAQAQSAGSPDTPTASMANPITTSEKGLFGFISAQVAAAAEKMPEENYSFKPTPDVRSFGQLVGHVADAQYFMCGTAAGDPPTQRGIEKTKTTKADLVAAVKDSTAYCQKAYGGLTDTTGAQLVKLMNFQMAKLTVMSLASAHTDEHYGNMVTYMRMKGIVPPSSAGGGGGNARPQPSTGTSQDKQ